MKKTLKQKTQDQRVLEKRNKVKNELYPVLEQKSDNIEDAKLICSGTAIAIQQAFINLMRTYKVGQLELDKMLNAQSDRYAVYKSVLDLFQSETISDAMEMLEGMPKEIENCITEESKKRKLGDLNIKFL